MSQQLPSWNKSILDRWLKRAFEQADPTRPTVAHGGVMPHLPTLDGTDSHMWLGWHRGEVAELAEVAHLMPRIVRFVSEFGAQSVPAVGRAVRRHVVRGPSSTGSSCASTTGWRSR